MLLCCLLILGRVVFYLPRFLRCSMCCCVSLFYSSWLIFSNPLFIDLFILRKWDWDREPILMSPVRPCSSSRWISRCSQVLNYSVWNSCQSGATRGAQCMSSVSLSLIGDSTVIRDAVLPEGIGPVAGLCHFWTLSPLARFASIQHAGCSTSWHVHSYAELVAGVCPTVCCGWPQHILHGHRIHPSLSGEWEAFGSAASSLGDDGAQLEAGLWGAALPEAGWAGASQGFVVWPHCVAAVHPAPAADDPSMSC